MKKKNCNNKKSYLCVWRRPHAVHVTVSSVSRNIFQVIVFAEGFIDKVEQGTVFDEEDQMR